MMDAKWWQKLILPLARWAKNVCGGFLFTSKAIYLKNHIAPVHILAALLKQKQYIHTHTQKKQVNVQWHTQDIVIYAPKLVTF
jgi:hypothetical protein